MRVRARLWLAASVCNTFTRATLPRTSAPNAGAALHGACTHTPVRDTAAQRQRTRRTAVRPQKSTHLLHGQLLEVGTVLGRLARSVTLVQECIVCALLAKVRQLDRVLHDPHLRLRVHVLVAEVDRLRPRPRQ